MLRKIDKAVDWIGSKQWLVVIFLSSTLGGIGVNWGLASYAWFVDGGPRLWLLVFLAAFLAISLVFTILGKVTASRNLDKVNADIAKQRLLKSSDYNPLEMTFENKVLRFEDLYDHYDRVLSDKTFKNCTFVGPGTMSFLDNFNDERGVFTDITLVSHEVPKAISSAVGFRNCKFFDCRYNGWILFMDNGQPSDVFIPMMERAGRKDFIIRETKKPT